MECLLEQYENSKNSLIKHFDCDQDYFVKLMTEYNWKISEIENIYFLSCWKHPKEKFEYVIVRKDGEPLIFKKNDLTMIIAIDCIKIAFVLKNNKKN